MTAYGTDFSCIDDLDGAMSFLGEGDETKALFQAIARRLIEPPAEPGDVSFIDGDENGESDGSYGLGIHRFVGASGVPTEVIARKIEVEAEKDERVYSAEFVGTLTDEELSGDLHLTTYVGNFSLTITANQFATVIEGG